VTVAPRAIGARRPRIEDPALLRGAGRYIDDIALGGMLHVAFARSPHAHARLLGVDMLAARAAPGVVAVLAAADLMPFVTSLRLPIAFPKGQLPPEVMPKILIDDEALFAGEAIAMVVAESRHAAEDAAELVEVSYDALPALANAPAAVKPGAPQACLGSPNLFAGFAVGYGDADTVFQRAPHVFRERLMQHRGGAHSIEGRGVVARYEADVMTVWSSTQMSHELRHTVAELLDLPEDAVRVVAPDVGGGFGAKYLVYPEEIAVAAASLMLERPVKWIEDRREHFLSAIQEREQHWDLEVATDGDGRLLGVRGTLVHDQGAYAPHAFNVPFNSATSLPGAYILPAYAMQVSVVRTNLPPVIPVRGAGYPQGCFALERLLDRAASELGIDRAEIRRRNLIGPDQMPYELPLRTRAGSVISYDTGDYLRCQETVLAAIDFAGFAGRRDAARRDGRHIGIGFAHAVKGSGRGPFESGLVRVMPNGRVSIYTGALAMGQGLKTALAQICADGLGVAVDQIDVTAGDTGFVSLGHGGYASRQTVTAGSSVKLAAGMVRDRAIRVAAQMLEVAESDLVIEDGRVHVVGAHGLGMPLGHIAAALRGLPGYAFPNTDEVGLEAEAHFRVDTLTYANAFHACEVEVDVETGAVTVLRYVAMHDSGRLINPLIAEGQVHGSIVHGIGNALFEHMVYSDEAQPLTTTFGDYLLPIAPSIPWLELTFMESPTPRNPLGVKGVGEVGLVPVTSAIASAVDHALEPFGVHITETPILPPRLLALIDAGRPEGVTR
jgi:carbon-monoxide dehydrogenase large subunit